MHGTQNLSMETHNCDYHLKTVTCATLRFAVQAEIFGGLAEEPEVELR